MIEAVFSFVGDVGMRSAGVFWAPMAVWSLTVLVALAVDGAGFRPSASVHFAIFRALFLALPAGLIVSLVRTFLAAAAPMGAADEHTLFSGISLPLLRVVPTTAWDIQGGSAAWASLGLLTILATGTALPALLRLWRTHRLSVRMVSQLPEVRDSEVLKKVEETRMKLGIRTRVRLLSGGFEPAPLVFGWAQPAIVLPDALLGQDDRLKMVLCHELAHIRNRDTLHGALERLFSALFVFNPLVGLLSRRIHILREVRCDAVVLSVHAAPARAYAQLLWDYAEVNRSTGRLGAFSTMAGSSSQLKQRILEMKHASSAFSARQVRFAALLGGLLFMLIAFLVGCTDVGSADKDADASPQMAEEPAGEVYTNVDQMPDIEGGIIPALSSVIRYPESARAEGAEGRVLVEFVVGEGGTVESANVVQGVREDLDAEAVRAVKSLTFAPGMHDGKAVKVKLVVPIQFKLQ